MDGGLEQCLELGQGGRCAAQFLALVPAGADREVLEAAVVGLTSSFALAWVVEDPAQIRDALKVETASERNAALATIRGSPTTALRRCTNPVSTTISVLDGKGYGVGHFIGQFQFLFVAIASGG